MIASKIAFNGRDHMQIPAGLGFQIRKPLPDLEADSMTSHDDDLQHFAAHGATPLPASGEQGYLEHNGARIWYAAYGAGTPLILLHGGLGHSGNWGYQLAALNAAGYRVVLVDSRGHGRSTRDDRPFTYELMAADVLAVMDALHLLKAAVAGWSDGACTAMVMAMQAPARIAGVFFFGCNMDPSGTKQITQPNLLLTRCFQRHAKDYAQLSATPERFEEFTGAVEQMMKTQPNYSSRDLTAISIPVAIVQSEQDEFIKAEHAQYLARYIAGSELIILPGVSHFAPLQRPDQFSSALLAFLARLPA